MDPLMNAKVSVLADARRRKGDVLGWRVFSGHGRRSSARSIPIRFFDGELTLGDGEPPLRLPGEVAAAIQS